MAGLAKKLNVALSVAAAVSDCCNVIELRTNCAHDENAAFATATIASVEYADLDPGWNGCLIIGSDPFWKFASHRRISARAVALAD